MIANDIVLRVRYGETDKMGFVYYGVYAQYFEVARTELIRKCGFAYDELEKAGVMLPVISLNIKYLKPCFYDDLLTIKAILKELPGVRISFEYQITNQQGELTTTGDTTLIFINANTKKPTKAPKEMIEGLQMNFTNKISQ